LVVGGRSSVQRLDPEEETLVSSEPTSQFDRDEPSLVLVEGGDPESAAVHAAVTQCVVREVNEESRRLSQSWDDSMPWVMICECGDPQCFETVALTLTAYEAVRRFPTHFAIVPGHQLEGLDRAIEEHDDYLVIEKVGVGAATAIRSDPRRTDPR
jgi:hypothetical protein